VLTNFERSTDGAPGGVAVGTGVGVPLDFLDLENFASAVVRIKAMQATHKKAAFILCSTSQIDLNSYKTNQSEARSPNAQPLQYRYGFESSNAF
jgi:hypothetical protein